MRSLSQAVTAAFGFPDFDSPARSLAASVLMLCSPWRTSRARSGSSGFAQPWL